MFLGSILVSTGIGGTNLKTNISDTSFEMVKSMSVLTNMGKVINNDGFWNMWKVYNDFLIPF